MDISRTLVMSIFSRGQLNLLEEKIQAQILQQIATISYPIPIGRKGRLHLEKPITFSTILATGFPQFYALSFLALLSSLIL